MRASRVVCVAGTEVLAGEPGFEHYLRLRPSVDTLDENSARSLLELRDAMLGLAGRSYSTVRPRMQGGMVVIEAEGSIKPGPAQPSRLARWRFTFDPRSGRSREASLPAPAATAQ